MIKINLLNSVTERQGGAVVSVEKKVSSPMTRLILMAIAVFVLTIAFIGLDVFSSRNEKARAEVALAEQKKKEKELEAVIKEQKDLEAKITNIDLRIDAIKKLRNSQAGPSAVLESIRERIGMTPDIYLESVDQKGDQLTIKGSSPVESSVTQFGRSLEFSSGLFSNLSIETQRQEIKSQSASADEEAPTKEVINFTIRCAYTPEKANSGSEEGVMTANNMTSKTEGDNRPQIRVKPDEPAPDEAKKPKEEKPKASKEAPNQDN